MRGGDFAKLKTQKFQTEAMITWKCLKCSGLLIHEFTPAAPCRDILYTSHPQIDSRWPNPARKSKTSILRDQPRCRLRDPFVITKAEESNKQIYCHKWLNGPPDFHRQGRRRNIVSKPSAIWATGAIISFMLC